MNKSELERILAWFANGVSNLCEMDENPEYIKRTVLAYYKNLHEAVKKYVKIDFNALTEEDCDLLGFGHWSSKEDADDDIKDLVEQMKECNSEDETNRLLEEITEAKRGVGLRLIPLWLYRQIPKGIELTDIYGKKFVFDGHGSKETRFGCLAYGIYPTNAKRYEDDDKKA